MTAIEIAERFERRSRNLQWSAWLVLLNALIILAGGLSAIIYAPLLTENDVRQNFATYDEKINAANTLIESMSKKWARDSEALSEANERCGNAYNEYFQRWIASGVNTPDDRRSHSLSFDVPAPESEIADAIEQELSNPKYAQFSNLGIDLSITCGNSVKRVTFVKPPADYKEIIATLREVKIPYDRITHVNAIKSHAALLDEIRFQQAVAAQLNTLKIAAAAAPNSHLPNSQSLQPADLTARLVQTSVTRFGLLAIAGFFVAILISLYRYNVRLAGFYLARADLFRIFGEEHLSITEASTMLNALTPTMGFGQSPQISFQPVTEILKVATNK